MSATPLTDKTPHRRYDPTFPRDQQASADRHRRQGPAFPPAVGLRPSLDPDALPGRGPTAGGKAKRKVSTPLTGPAPSGMTCTDSACACNRPAYDGESVACWRGRTRSMRLHSICGLAPAAATAWSPLPPDHWRGVDRGLRPPDLRQQLLQPAGRNWPQEMQGEGPSNGKPESRSRRRVTMRTLPPHMSRAALRTADVRITSRWSWRE